MNINFALKKVLEFISLQMLNFRTFFILHSKVLEIYIILLWNAGEISVALL